MPYQPLAHLRMLVGCVVVDDGVDQFLDRHLCLDGVEEADELLVPVALHVSADDGAVEDVESGEQRGSRGSSFQHGPASSADQAECGRAPGFGSSHRPRDDGMGWRIDIEADDVAQLVDKLRVGGELELFHPMRMKAVRTPDALDGTRADIKERLPSWRRSSGSPLLAARSG